MKTIRVGLLGLGTVGGAVYQLLIERQGYLAQKSGFRFEVKKVLIQEPDKKRGVMPPTELLTTHAAQVLRDPEIDVIVELIGGLHPAATYIAEAIEAGKQVVTANKALLALKGAEFFEQAARRGVSLGFEAAVAGGIPILNAIRQGLVGNRIEALFGIINGTTNYILSTMSQKGREFSEALEEASRLGFAERDPKKDLEGEDAREKLGLLIAACAGTFAKKDEIYSEGIQGVTALDIEGAKRLGMVIKPLAIAKFNAGGCQARVHPALVPIHHPLADVEGCFNAVYLRGDVVGETLFYGAGAGGRPTASAVLADLVQAGLVASGQAVPWTGGVGERLHFLPITDLTSEYYLRFSVVDRPGALGEIASALGKNGVSIASVHQEKRGADQKVPILVMTHEAREDKLRQALQVIDRFDSVLDRTFSLRVERL